MHTIWDFSFLKQMGIPHKKEHFVCIIRYISLRHLVKLLADFRKLMYHARGHYRCLGKFKVSLDKRLRFVVLQRNTLICIEGILSKSIDFLFFFFFTKGHLQLSTTCFKIEIFIQTVSQYQIRVAISSLQYFHLNY